MPLGVRGFQKGQSGNPGGRPKRDWTFAQLYEEELEKQLPTTDGTTLLAKHAVVKRIVRMAVEGDIAAIKELTARLDGQPKQSMEMDGGVNPDGTVRPIYINTGNGFIPTNITPSIPPTLPKESVNSDIIEAKDA